MFGVGFQVYCLSLNSHIVADYLIYRKFGGDYNVLSRNLDSSWR